MSQTLDLRGTADKFSECLEGRIRNVYHDLFDTVRDALNPQYEPQVRAYFTNSFRDVKDSMLKKMTNCFLCLRDIVSTKGDIQLSEQHEKQARAEKNLLKVPPKSQGKQVQDPLRKSRNTAKDILLVLNLNLNINADDSEEQIEKLFMNIATAKLNVFG